ncbi:DDE-type integrase/transposase/recombinase [Paenibacillus algorifonticola]|uniref:IS66 family insertion sequence element accessory protein TnpA n=1 Tax=Paenibacillus algorifonticola TaxID=684063 RepID=UPI003D2993F7
MNANEQRRQEWADRVSAYKSSGLTIVGRCAANECTIHQLKYWLYKSKSKQSSVSQTLSPQWVPITVTGKDTFTGHAASLQVRVGLASIELQPGFDLKLLREVVDSNHEWPIALNELQQDFSVTRPKEKWVVDITYIPCRQGKLYLGSILDLYTKQIVGWQLVDHMTTDPVLDALKQTYAAKNHIYF